ncbi:hypothetical protein ACHWQZ_G001910 [Mnemiopsis leidyi]
MPVYEDPVDGVVELEDRFTEFARYTLQGEQDFHVGLRTDLEREYQRFGVRSDFFVPTATSPSTFKTFDDMENDRGCTLAASDDVPQQASRIVNSVLNQVNNKLTSGEISLSANHHDNGGLKSPGRSGRNNYAIESAGMQTSNIPELEDALKNISERIERILSPSSGSIDATKEELLGEIQSQIQAESVRALSKVSEYEEQVQSERAARISKSQSNLRSSVSSSPSRPSLHQDQEQFNFEEIIRKKTGRGLDSAHMDVEAEKEWELETENMPMEVINSPHAQSHRMYDDKRKDNRQQKHHIMIEDVDSVERNNNILRSAAISDDKKAPEIIEGEIAVLTKEVKWLEDEIKSLRETVVERNAQLAESHQLRRNLEEELSLMHRKNSGLEQSTAATMKQLNKKIEAGQIQVRTQSLETPDSLSNGDEMRSLTGINKSRLCAIL